MGHTKQFGYISSNTHKVKKTKITQLQLILVHSLWWNVPFHVELFSILFFKRANRIISLLKEMIHLLRFLQTFKCNLIFMQNSLFNNCALILAMCLRGCVFNALLLDGSWLFLDDRWKLPNPVPPRVDYFFIVSFAF